MNQHLESIKDISNNFDRSSRNSSKELVSHENEDQEAHESQLNTEFNDFEKFTTDENEDQEAQLKRINRKLDYFEQKLFHSQGGDKTRRSDLLTSVVGNVSDTSEDIEEKEEIEGDGENKDKGFFGKIFSLGGGVLGTIVGGAMLGGTYAKNKFFGDSSDENSATQQGTPQNEKISGEAKKESQDISKQIDKIEAQSQGTKEKETGQGILEKEYQEVKNDRPYLKENPNYTSGISAFTNFFRSDENQVKKFIPNMEFFNNSNIFNESRNAEGENTRFKQSFLGRDSNLSSFYGKKEFLEKKLLDKENQLRILELVARDPEVDSSHPEFVELVSKTTDDISRLRGDITSLGTNQKDILRYNEVKNDKQAKDMFLEGWKGDDSEMMNSVVELKNQNKWKEKASKKGGKLSVEDLKEFEKESLERHEKLSNFSNIEEFNRKSLNGDMNSALNFGVLDKKAPEYVKNEYKEENKEKVKANLGATKDTSTPSGNSQEVVSETSATSAESQEANVSGKSTESISPNSNNANVSSKKSTPTSNIPLDSTNKELAEKTSHIPVPNEVVNEKNTTNEFRHEKKQNPQSEYESGKLDESNTEFLNKGK